MEQKNFTFNLLGGFQASFRWHTVIDDQLIDLLNIWMDDQRESDVPYLIVLSKVVHSLFRLIIAN